MNRQRYYKYVIILTKIDVPKSGTRMGHESKMSSKNSNSSYSVPEVWELNNFNKLTRLMPSERFSSRIEFPLSSRRWDMNQGESELSERINYESFRSQALGLES